MKRWTKTLSISGCMIALAMTSWALAQNGSSVEVGDPALQVTLSTNASVIYTRKRVPLRVTFEVAESNIRLLRLFKPTREFFDVSLEDTAGNLVPVLKSAPATQDSIPSTKDLQYLELRDGEAFSTQVDVAELLPQDLKEGRYRITLTYHNEHGDNCFRGTKKSNSVVVSIVAEPVADVRDSISEPKAIELARRAVVGKVNLTPDAKVSVRNTAKQLIVTFGGPPPAGMLGPDYEAQVRINRMTGEIEEVLGGS